MDQTKPIAFVDTDSVLPLEFEVSSSNRRYDRLLHSKTHHYLNFSEEMFAMVQWAPKSSRV